MKTTTHSVFENIPKNATKIQLSEGFLAFPEELFAFKDTLEILDLSKNRLSQLPDSFKEFKKLKIAFFSENDFEVFPEVLGECPSLTMVGFKSNRIKSIPKNAFPKDLQWLILTDNQLEQLPESIGECHRLQKCALAGNQLVELPDSMQQCLKLELLRISANQLSQIPTWLVQLPRLSWLAVDGNPCSTPRNLTDLLLEKVGFNSLIINDKIGEGASGFIYKVDWKDQNKSVAVKIFKGDVTSDGYPQDELENCLLVGRHENIVPLIGPFENHPEQKTGIVMDFIPNAFQTLGLPPSFATCTRDVFTEDRKLTAKQACQIAFSIAKGALHLHQKGVMHGDLYAHNTLFHIETGEAYLGDFGASTHYDVSSVLAPYFERLDVRAYGCLLDDILSVCTEKNDVTEKLEALRDFCWNTKILERPNFDELVDKLKLFTSLSNVF
jgi:hypothetical protein